MYRKANVLPIGVRRIAITFGHVATGIERPRIFGALPRTSGDGVGTLVRIGSCGTKHFIDTTVPLGTFMATYYVRACRGKRAGPMSAAASIQFGSVMGVMGVLAPSSPMSIKRAA